MITRLLLILIAYTLTLTAHAQSNSKIKALQKQRGTIQKEINETEKLLISTKKDVKAQLGNLSVIDGQIDERKSYINVIETDIQTIEKEVKLLERQLNTLQSELNDKKMRFEMSMQYMRRNKSIQNQLVYALSAQKVSQMYRRLRYVREYSTYQRAQGEQIQEKQLLVEKKKSDLQIAKAEKDSLLAESQREHLILEQKHKERETFIANLQKKQKNLTNQVAQKKKQNASLEKQIDKLIEAEIAAQKKRAEEQARKEAAARKAADAKRRAEAEAARKAAAQAAADNIRKVNEAQEAEKKAIAAQKAAANRSQEEAKAAAKAAEEAKARTAAAKAKQVEDAKVAATPVKETPKTEYVNTNEHKLSGSFESNKGRLAVPITGSYVIGGRFGTYNVAGLKNVKLDNKGTTYIGRPGAQARAIFQGEVSAVFQFDGLMNVMVRHGSYISVYCNLSSVTVKKGQKVNARDVLGNVANDGTGNHALDFQLRKETTKLNPEVWIGR